MDEEQDQWASLPVRVAVLEAKVKLISLTLKGAVCVLFGSVVGYLAKQYF